MNSKQYQVCILVSFSLIIIIGIPLAIFDPDLKYPIMIIPMIGCAASCVIFAWFAPIENKEKSATELLKDEDKN